MLHLSNEFIVFHVALLITCKLVPLSRRASFLPTWLSIVYLAHGCITLQKDKVTSASQSGKVTQLNLNVMANEVKEVDEAGLLLFQL